MRSMSGRAIAPIFSYLPFFLLITLLVGPGRLSAVGWMTDLDMARTKAEQENKLILLNFSGSDWCNPCMAMKTSIFEQDAFTSFAVQQLILVNADFPRLRKNKLPGPLVESNEKLAEEFNPKGLFPMTILMDAGGERLRTWKGLPDRGVEAFVEEIKLHTGKKSEVAGNPGERVFKRSAALMGSRFDFTVVAAGQQLADEWFDAAIAEVMRIERLISSWDEQTQTSAINRSAGIAPVQVDTELLELILRANKVSALSQGAFDITFGSIDDEIWRFDGTMTALPDPEVAKEAVRLIDCNNILVDPEKSTVMLRHEGMKIGFGGIGKGYAADRARQLLVDKGAASGVVNAGGDLIAWGLQPGGKPWTVGIANPDLKNAAFSWLEVRDQAVVTSGNYEKYVVIDGKHYSHIIDPRNGMPVSGLKSVTIFCPSAELADALATAVFVLGKTVGLDLVNQLKGVDCLIVDEDGKLAASDRISLQLGKKGVQETAGSQNQKATNSQDHTIEQPKDKPLDH